METASNARESSFIQAHFLESSAYKAWIAPFSAGWRQRDAYSREEDTGSQLHVLPHCYDGGVTAVTDAIQQWLINAGC
ncbi:hypothetical protein DENIT_11905 [Pseudomonas veronii]|nr:hypothetical protein DENIT_11905 [Pseudomonas veronii]